MANPATASDVTELLGEIDAFLIERILDTKATPDEVSEALGLVEQEERGFDEAPHPPSTPKVAEVRAILLQQRGIDRAGRDEEETEQRI